MSWTKVPVGHQVATQHKFSVAGIDLVTSVNDLSRARVSKESVGRCPNAINLDRSEINNLIELLIAWKDKS